MGFCSKGLKNEFETAVVNEPLVFEPLKFYCIYYLGVVYEKPYSTLLERSVVYIQITKSSHATSVTSKKNVALYNLIGRRRCSAVGRKTACK